jgi:hypothetical protein
MAKGILASQDASKKWLPKIGLLMLLQEAYGFYIESFYITDRTTGPADIYKKWRTWRLNKFQPEQIQKNAQMSIDDIKQLYEDLARLGYINDPLSSWFVLLQLINKAKKEKLKNHALLSQEYYKLSKMVSFFIFDLTKEKMPDPDDVMDEGKGEWKRKIYGDPFDYESKQTQLRIFDNFLIDRPYRIALIYEGDTEDIVIKMIFDALYVNHERDGVFLYNAEGQGNIEKNLYSLAELAKKNEMSIFLMLDRDARWLRIIKNFKKHGYIKEGRYHVWKKDFESDNFEIYEIVEKLNNILTNKGLKMINREELENKMSNTNITLRKAISGLIYKENGIDLDRVISNIELGKVLILPTIERIKIERDGDDGWNPLLPIEKVLQNIFSLIPKFIG